MLMGAETRFPLPLIRLHTAGSLPDSIVASQVRTLHNGMLQEQNDWLAVEEPLEIRVAGPAQDTVSVAVTMRTPGHDYELAVGFLHAEGFVASRAAVVTVETPTLAWSEDPCNVVTVRLAEPFDPTRLQRNFFATSSCGVCGKASLAQLAVHCPPVAAGPLLAPAVLSHLPIRMRQQQQVFEQTGGLHAAGLFDVGGELLTLREDVGRHNALDKLIGAAFLKNELPLTDKILLLSGRASFELVQKATMAGIKIIAAVGAPSSLAVELGREAGITWIGLFRNEGFNIYTGEQSSR